MAYDEILAERIRKRFSSFNDVEEKRLMGGLTFMYNGKMCVGILKNELLCRIDPEKHNDAIKQKGVRTLDFTKRPMSGFILVSPAAMKSEAAFNSWIDLALEFNSRAKSSKKRKK